VYLEHFLKSLPKDFDNETIALLNDRIGLAYRYLGEYDKSETAFAKASTFFGTSKNSIGAIDVWAH